MTAVNEEFISEYARAVGNAFYATSIGVGNETTPGTSLYYLAQLQSLASNQLPSFGVIEASPSPFTVSADPNDARFVIISTGQIAYKGDIISIPPQRLSIVRNFGSTYNTSDVYGMRIGFPISQASLTVGTIYTTVLSQAANPGDTLVYIVNPSIASKLGFPLTAYLGGTTYVVFSGLNSAGTALQVDPGFNDGAGLPGGVSFGIGARLNFIYEPRFSALYGLPVSVGSNDPSVFGYYPWLPQDWLPIADLLIVNPQNPVVATFGINPAILSTVIAYPPPKSNSPVFAPADALIINSAVNIARAQLRQHSDIASVSDSIRAIEQYTNAVSDKPSLSFREFWGTRPFAPTTYFGKGISFEGLERFEFSNNFASAYFALNNIDVQRTFGIFRGDLYAHPSTLAGTPPTTLQLNSHAALGVPSTFNRGTYIYGVSAVKSGGETPPIYGSTIADNTLASLFVNEIQWSTVSGAIFYHIYRRSSIGGDQTEVRLTNPNQITGSGIFSQPSVIGNTDNALTDNFTAFKISTTGSSQLGGILMRLRATNSLLTNTTDTVNIALYTDNSGVPGTAVAGGTGTSITFGEIITDLNGNLTTGYQEFISQITKLVTANSFYWIVVTLSNQPSVGQIMLQSGTVGTALYSTSPDDSTWTNIDNIDVYYKILGWLDNGQVGVMQTSRGVYLTNEITLQPRQLRVFVPDIINVNNGDLPLYGQNGDPSITSNETTVTKNDMVVTVTAQLGATGTPTALSVTVPQGTPRNIAFPLGLSTQKFDRVSNIQVVAGSNVNTGVNGAVLWSIYDFITVETMP